MHLLNSKNQRGRFFLKNNCMSIAHLHNDTLQKILFQLERFHYTDAQGKQCLNVGDHCAFTTQLMCPHRFPFRQLHARPHRRGPARGGRGHRAGHDGAARRRRLPRQPALLLLGRRVLHAAGPVRAGAGRCVCAAHVPSPWDGTVAFIRPVFHACHT